jgi:hypothetical protein
MESMTNERPLTESIIIYYQLINHLINKTIESKLT